MDSRSLSVKTKLIPHNLPRNNIMQPFGWVLRRSVHVSHLASVSDILSRPPIFLAYEAVILFLNSECGNYFLVAYWYANDSASS